MDTSITRHSITRLLLLALLQRRSVPGFSLPNQKSFGGDNCDARGRLEAIAEFAIVLRKAFRGIRGRMEECIRKDGAQVGHYSLGLLSVPFEN